MTTRTAKLGLLHSLKRDLALDDDGYRDKLFQVTGRRSAKDLSDAQLDTAIDAFRPARAPGTAVSPYVAKLKALYIAAFNLGAFEDGTDAAIAAFVERQTGKKALRFLTPGDANKVSEGLKAICARHGFDVPAGDAGGLESRRALLKAQWARLVALGVMGNAHHWAMENYLSRKYLTFHGGLVHLDKSKLDAAQRHFGWKIRKARAQQPARRE
jgi:hypothetical protein